jgi:hypothetical protein
MGSDRILGVWLLILCCLPAANTLLEIVALKPLTLCMNGEWTEGVKFRWYELRTNDHAW